MGDFHITTLMFATLIAVLAIGGFLFWRHMRKPENRHPMADQRERNIEEIRRGEPPQR